MTPDRLRQGRTRYTQNVASSTLSEKLQSGLAALPARPGVYIMRNAAGEVIALHNSWNERTGTRHAVSWEAIAAFLTNAGLP